MKRLLNLFLLLMLVGSAYAASVGAGIIVTYQGAETSYRFDEMPTVKYTGEGNNQSAVLYVKGSGSPVATFQLHGKKLIVTYSEYVPTSIEGVPADKAVITERNGKKIVQGGKLIIVSKDGRKYDINGTEIK